MVKCKKNDRDQSCTFFNCEEVQRIIDEQKNETIDNTFANIITNAINENALGDVQKLESVVLLGGGSHMIFIQDALKKALEAKLSGRKIQLYTITKTNGENYGAIYQDDDTITTANFLAYAAALYGESLEEKKNRSSFTPIESFRPIVSSPPFTYVLAANHPTEEKTIYYMMPENFSNGDIYYLYPGLWRNDSNADISSEMLCIVKRNSGDIEHE